MIEIRKCYEQLDYAPDGVHGRKANEKWKFAKLFHMFNFDFFFFQFLPSYCAFL